MEDVCESVGDVCGNVIPYTEEGVLLCVNNFEYLSNNVYCCFIVTMYSGYFSYNK